MDMMGISIDHVIDLKVPFEDIVQRMAGRRFHVESGRSYHESFNPPKKGWIR